MAREDWTGRVVRGVRSAVNAAKTAATVQREELTRWSEKITIENHELQDQAAQMAKHYRNEVTIATELRAELHQAYTEEGAMQFLHQREAKAREVEAQEAAGKSLALHDIQQRALQRRLAQAEAKVKTVELELQDSSQKALEAEFAEHREFSQQALHEAHSDCEGLRKELALEQAQALRAAEALQATEETQASVDSEATIAARNQSVELQEQLRRMIPEMELSRSEQEEHQRVAEAHRRALEGQEALVQAARNEAEEARRSAEASRNEAMEARRNAEAAEVKMQKFALEMKMLAESGDGKPRLSPRNPGDLGPGDEAAAGQSWVGNSLTGNNLIAIPSANNGVDKAVAIGSAPKRQSGVSTLNAVDEQALSQLGRLNTEVLTRLSEQLRSVSDARLAAKMVAGERPLTAKTAQLKAMRAIEQQTSELDATNRRLASMLVDRGCADQAWADGLWARAAQAESGGSENLRADGGYDGPEAAIGGGNLSGQRQHQDLQQGSGVFPRRSRPWVTAHARKEQGVALSLSLQSTTQRLEALRSRLKRYEVAA